MLKKKTNVKTKFYFYFLINLKDSIWLSGINNSNVIRDGRRNWNTFIVFLYNTRKRILLSEGRLIILKNIY